MFKSVLVIFIFGFFGCTTLKKPFFYKATAGDGKTSYILGTMHLGIPYNDIPSYIREKFNDSKILYVEMDITSDLVVGNHTRNSNIDLVRDLELSKAFKREKLGIVSGHPATNNLNTLYYYAGNSAMNATYYSSSDQRRSAYFKTGQSLKTRLSPVLWNFLVSELAPFFDEKTIENLHVESVEEILKVLRPNEMLVSAAKARRFDTRWSLDRSLIEKAHASKKIVVSLELPEDDSPECAAEVSLFKIQENLTWNSDRAHKRLEDLEFYYRQGDEKALIEYLAKDGQADLNSCLLIDRNLAWLPIIQRTQERSASPKDTFFIAVGVAHLVGSKSVLELLKEKGYTVERVKVD